MAPSMWTIGHSTRSIEAFIELLQAHDIQLLGDVRTIPYSRRNPQFNTDALAESLVRAGLQYRHLPALGGRRKSRPDSVNRGWRSAGFQGYADYMQTDDFRAGLEELMAHSGERQTAIMCAEAVPWRCHRSLIADTLVSRGWQVWHILSTAEGRPHQITPFATIEQSSLIYPEESSQEMGSTHKQEGVIMRSRFTSFLGILGLGVVASGCGMLESAPATTEKSLYDRLGGKPAITAVVDDFVGRVAADNRINGKFANADLPRLKMMLVDQICQASGGPCTYTGQDMKTAHAGMGINSSEFEALVRDLIASLNKFKVAEQEKNELLGALGPMKNDIVERP